MQLEKDYLRLGKDEYHYRVDVFISTFNVFEPYSHSEIFESDNLQEAREKALIRGYELISILEKQGMFFLPFASPEEFVVGENSCYSVTVSFVEHIDDAYSEYPIFGEDEFSTAEALQFEKEIFENLLNNED